MSTSLQMCIKLANKISYFYKLYVSRDPFLWNLKKWFADRGDERLKFDYPLNESSLVFDVGGYLGDYTERISNKFGCRVYLFEPVPAFYDQCVKRFSNKPLVACLNYAISATSGFFDMNVNSDASSLIKKENGIIQQVQVRSIIEVISDLNVGEIDLVSINIEGGEFDLLPAMIDSGLIKHVKYIQVQFHNVVAGAVDMRLRIRALLEKTHREMWNYEFVWESWELIS